MQPICRRTTRTMPVKIEFSPSSIACVSMRPKTVQRTMRSVAHAYDAPGPTTASRSSEVASTIESLIEMRSGSDSVVSSITAIVPRIVRSMVTRPARLRRSRLDSSGAAGLQSGRTVQPGTSVQRRMTSRALTGLSPFPSTRSGRPTTRMPSSVKRDFSLSVTLSASPRDG